MSMKVLKTQMHGRKSKITYDLLIFMTCLSKILENDLPFGMIRFRKFFEMIFRFGNAQLSKIQADDFAFSYAPYFMPEIHPIFMINKMKFFTDMIRGKSPRFRNEGAGSHRKERSSRREAPNHSEKKIPPNHIEKMLPCHSEKISHKSKRKSKINLNAIPK